MHVNLVLLRGGPLSTDFRLAERQSSVPGEISLLDSETPFFFLRSRKPKHEAHDDRSQLNFLHVLLSRRKSHP